MQRLPELDALRGIAAVVIMLFHLRFMGRHPRWGSGFDIDVFFVLSGYLITTSILHGRRAANFFRVFYFRRVIRIWPIYYLVMLACVLVNPLLPRPDALGDAGLYLTFTQNVPTYWTNQHSYFSRFFLHTWTLAIEEQFYLIWPWLIHRFGRRGLFWMAGPLLLIPIITRGLGFHGQLLMTRCDSVILGSVLAGLLIDLDGVKRHAMAYRSAFAAIGLVAFSVPLWRDPLWLRVGRLWPTLDWGPWVFSVETFRVALADFGLVGLVIAASGTRALAPLRDGRLRYIGRISYSLYMYHPIVFGLVALAWLRLGLPRGPWVDLVKAASCFGVAALSWRFIERPILAMKDLVPYRVESPLFRGPHTPAREGRPGELFGRGVADVADA